MNLLVTVATEDGDVLLSLSAAVEDETFLLAAVERAVLDTAEEVDS